MEIYSILWVDTPSNNSDKKYKIQAQLRSFINDLRIFVDQYECENYIRSLSPNERIVMIINGQLAKDFVSQIHQFEHISSIYIFSSDRKKHEVWINDYPKVRSIITKLSDVVYEIEYEQKRRNENKVEQILSMNILTEKEFIYSQCLIMSLLQMKSPRTEKLQLIEICRNLYQTNESEVTNIDEFEADYVSCKALYWYTRDCFLSKLLSKALLVQNYHLLFHFRFFLQDLNQQIQDNQLGKSVRLYRGQILSSKQLDLFTNSIGVILSINSFLLTNLNRKQSMSYVKTSQHTHRVLFEINADPKLHGIKPFANITSHSYSRGEQQILFMCGSLFRIDSIDDDEHRIKIIRMTLTSLPDEEQLTFDLSAFGQMLVEMKKFSEGEIYFNYLIEESTNLLQCYHSLALIAFEKNEYDLSLQWLKKLLESSEDNRGVIHNEMGMVYFKKGDFQRALQSLNMALQIYEEMNEDGNRAHIRECYNNIALVYRDEKNYEEAKNFYLKSLSTEEDQAASHRNVALMCSHLRQYDLALQHCNDALQIYEEVRPRPYFLISILFESLANIYYDREEFDQSLEYYQKAKDIYQSILPSNHPDVLQIGLVLRRLKYKLKSLADEK